VLIVLSERLGKAFRRRRTRSLSKGLTTNITALRDISRQEIEEIHHLRQPVILSVTTDPSSTGTLAWQWTRGWTDDDRMTRYLAEIKAFQ
jgi:hypothetical protein